MYIYIPCASKQCSEFSSMGHHELKQCCAMLMVFYLKWTQIGGVYSPVSSNMARKSSDECRFFEGNIT